MTHFGILCLPDSGHINPMAALGSELQRRGHRVTFFQIPDIQQKISAVGIDCQIIGQSEFPLGYYFEINALRGEKTGLSAIRYSIEFFVKKLTSMFLREAPDAIRAVGIDALLVDQYLPAGGAIAEFLDIPFITVCNALLANVEASVPSAFAPWFLSQYNTSWWGYLRNQVSYYLFARLTQPILAVVNEYRRQWKLPEYSQPDEHYSKLAQICPQPANFEFPRRNLPPCFHFTGPFIDLTSRKTVPFPFEKLTGQPLIYASMGTLLNRHIKIFDTIAQACVGLDVQLVISLGRSAGLNSLPEFPGSPLVVEYAPQLELLERASLTITHAGLNTTMESLAKAVPLVAIPIGNDQPAVAARIAWTRVGEVIPIARLNTRRLRAAIQQVLTNDLYSKNASRLQTAIQSAGGVSRAADIIDQTISVHLNNPQFPNESNVIP